MYTREQAEDDYAAELEAVNKRLLGVGNKTALYVKLLRERRKWKDDLADIRSGKVEGFKIVDYEMYNY